ncbi:MAG: hypothetical protein IT531_00895 [Burkholderiales bacterium]|nr:hypothetical protein [Burkholderiales bacterium]
MLRAAAVCEKAGIASANLVCEGFVALAAASSRGLGLPNIPIALIAGHPGTQSAAELERNISAVTVDAVIANLLHAPPAAAGESEPQEREIVCTGGFDAVNRYFYQQRLSDGLPIVPPTRAKIDAFLAYTERDPDESLATVLPDSRAATVWSIAVNGVMAGCRPEYMPVLVAVVEAMVDPQYGVEHSGSTPGGDALIILNGPIIEELEFNSSQGVLRDGFMANTTVGRFWRLYLRNIAGFLPHQNDKGTHGHTWRVVLAENEAVLSAIGWPPVCADMGLAAGTNAVTVARYTGGNAVTSVSGETPEQMLPYLADGLTRQISWQLVFTVGSQGGTLRPLMVLSPMIARTIARAGWSKTQVQRYLYEHARLPAWQVERLLRDWNIRPAWNLAEEVAAGRLPRAFHASDDPQRLVPLVWKPEDYMIAVAGDPMRNNAYIFAHQGVLGYPTTKAIHLPKDWSARLGARG